MKHCFVAIATLVASLLGSSALAQPVTARVTMEGTTIAVQPDPIRVTKARGAVVIRWELPADANYSFDPQGIVINGERVGSQLRPQDQIAHCGGRLKRGLVQIHLEPVFQGAEQFYPLN